MFISAFCNGQESPNFLWLVCEDQSLFFSIYGDSSANTPNINQLAEDGIVYQNCYTPSPVCAPSRSSLITGMYPTTLGTQHMRAYKKAIANNMHVVTARIKGPGYGKAASLRGLKMAGVKIIHIQDVSPLPFNGCRPKKKRRV